VTQLLEGKVAIITGGAGGLGQAMARKFLRAGAAVVLADLNAEALQSVAAELKSMGEVLAVPGDVRSEDDVQQTVDVCRAEFGALDVMVNNAGFTRDATMRKMPLADFQEVLNVHLVGTWLGVRAASAVMREQQSGAIINISSIAGKIGNVGQTNYSAAKAGMIGLTKAAAKELAHVGVRVNAIQPGLIRTAMTTGMRADIWDRKIAAIPMGRAGEPGEVADVAVFLASDMSSYITGAVLEVTGGRDM
jgi:3-oxoacyl-[acyl-carrier protein] reductase